MLVGKYEIKASYSALSPLLRKIQMERVKAFIEWGKGVYGKRKICLLAGARGELAKDAKGDFWFTGIEEVGARRAQRERELGVGSLELGV